MQRLKHTKGCDFNLSWVLDCETDGLGKPGKPPELMLCVIEHPWHGYKDFWGKSALHDALNFIIESGGGDVYAHAGGRFDFRLAYSWLLKRGAKGSLIFSGASVLVSDFELTDSEGHLVKLTLCDTVRLFPSKLEKVGESLGVPKLKWDHNKTKQTVKTVKGQLAFLEYCKRDVEVLRKALTRFQDIVLPLGIGPRRTLAATCTSVARHRLIDIPQVPEALEDEALSCVYGGRTEPFRYDPLTKGSIFDIHSSYPAATAKAPVPWHFVGKLDKISLCEAGMVTAEVTVPECHIPLLPARFKSQPGRVFFPTGTFEGTWTIEELRSAVERKVARVNRIVKAFVFTESSFLQEFAKWAWKQRVESKSEFERYFWKIWANSFVGKLIEKKEKVKATFGFPKGVNADDLLFCTEFRIGGETVWLQPTAYMPPFRHAVAGATILARARVALWDYLNKVNLKAWYCDTDSVVTNGTLPIGPRLGELGKESIRNGVFLAPKFYTYETPNSDGTWRRVVKSKGMPSDFDAFKRLALGKSVTINRTSGFRESLRRRKTVEYETVKVVKRLHGDTRPKRRVLDSGMTVPWDARELEG